MISDKLKQDALDFLSAVEAVAKDEGYQAAKKEFDAQAAQLKYDYDKRIVEARETYYNEGFKDGQNEHGGEQQSVPVVHDGVSYADGEEFSNEASMLVASFAYTRKFPANWGTIVLPVALNYSDWSGKFEIAEIIGVGIVNGKISTKKRILGAGSQTLPNHPYLIRAKVASTKTQAITKSNCLMFPADEGSITIPYNGKNYTFKGTYKTLSVEDLEGKYYSNGGYFVNAISLCKPMRVILEITE